MGKPITTEDAIRVFGLDADAVETLTDSDGESLVLALQGTALIVIVNSPTDLLRANCHDHDSVEEAQQCAATVMEEAQARLAEYEALKAMAGDITVALSQVDNLSGGMWV